MTATSVLNEAFGRVQSIAHGAVKDLTPEQLSSRPDDEGNSIAWLVWHLARVQDDHIADVAGVEQQWTSAGWNKRFELPLDDGDIGYGHSSEQVSVVHANADLLCDYLDAVQAATAQYIAGLEDADLDRIVDERWDPPVTLRVRLVSVLSDDLQHAGQAAYVRGLIVR
jgi:uncharacterized damage-inducible protein DinB